MGSDERFFCKRLPGPPDGKPAHVGRLAAHLTEHEKDDPLPMATAANPTRDDFAALLNESLGGEN
jgi:small subunit ribosomal protein S1